MSVNVMDRQRQHMREDSFPVVFSKIWCETTFSVINLLVGGKKTCLACRRHFVPVSHWLPARWGEFHRGCTRRKCPQTPVWNVSASEICEAVCSNGERSLNYGRAEKHKYFSITERSNSARFLIGNEETAESHSEAKWRIVATVGTGSPLTSTTGLGYLVLME